MVGVLAPKGTDEAVVAKLSAAIDKALDDPDTRQQLAAQSMEPMKAGPREFQAFIDGEIGRWAALIKANNITVN